MSGENEKFNLIKIKSKRNNISVGKSKPIVNNYFYSKSSKLKIFLYIVFFLLITVSLFRITYLGGTFLDNFFFGLIFGYMRYFFYISFYIIIFLKITKLEYKIKYKNFYLFFYISIIIFSAWVFAGYYDNYARIHHIHTFSFKSIWHKYSLDQSKGWHNLKYVTKNYQDIPGGLVGTFITSIFFSIHNIIGANIIFWFLTIALYFVGFGYYFFKDFNFILKFFKSIVLIIKLWIRSGYEKTYWKLLRINSKRTIKYPDLQKQISGIMPLKKYLYSDKKYMSQGSGSFEIIEEGDKKEIYDVKVLNEKIDNIKKNYKDNDVNDYFYENEKRKVINKKNINYSNTNEILSKTTEIFRNVVLTKNKKNKLNKIFNFIPKYKNTYYEEKIFELLPSLKINLMRLKMNSKEFVLNEIKDVIFRDDNTMYVKKAIKNDASEIMKIIGNCKIKTIVNKTALSSCFIKYYFLVRMEKKDDRILINSLTEIVDSENIKIYHLDNGKSILAIYIKINKYLERNEDLKSLIGRNKIKINLKFILGLDKTDKFNPQLFVKPKANILVTFDFYIQAQNIITNILNSIMINDVPAKTNIILFTNNKKYYKKYAKSPFLISDIFEYSDNLSQIFSNIFVEIRNRINLIKFFSCENVDKYNLNKKNNDFKIPTLLIIFDNILEIINFDICKQIINLTTLSIPLKIKIIITSNKKNNDFIKILSDSKYYDIIKFNDYNSNELWNKIKNNQISNQVYDFSYYHNNKKNYKSNSLFVDENYTNQLIGYWEKNIKICLDPGIMKEENNNLVNINDSFYQKIKIYVSKWEIINLRILFKFFKIANDNDCKYIIKKLEDEEIISKEYTNDFFIRVVLNK